MAPGAKLEPRPHYTVDLHAGPQSQTPLLKKQYPSTGSELHLCTPVIHKKRVYGVWTRKLWVEMIKFKLLLPFRPHFNPLPHSPISLLFLLLVTLQDTANQQPVYSLCKSHPTILCPPCSSNCQEIIFTHLSMYEHGLYFPQLIRHVQIEGWMFVGYRWTQSHIE